MKGLREALRRRRLGCRARDEVNHGSYRARIAVIERDVNTIAIPKKAPTLLLYLIRIPLTNVAGAKVVAGTSPALGKVACPISIDIGPQIKYKPASNLAHLKGRVLEAHLNTERVRCPRAEFALRSRAALGIIWPALRPVREVHSLDWDRRARVTPVEERKVSAPRLVRPYRIERPATSQEAWPGAEPSGRKSRWQEPRWNADRRACPLPTLPRKRGRGKRKGWAPHREMRRLIHTFVGVPLPFSVVRMVKWRVANRELAKTLQPLIPA